MTEVMERAQEEQGKKWVQIPTTIRPEQYDRLRQMSAREDIPMSILIRRAIGKLLTEGL